MKFTILVAVILATIRVYIGATIEPPKMDWVDAYKDSAHLFMGGLFVAWWIRRQTWQMAVFVVLNVVEVSVAVWSRI